MADEPGCGVEAREVVARAEADAILDALASAQSGEPNGSGVVAAHSGEGQA